MSRRRRQGPIGWLLAAFRADPVLVIAWAVVLTAGIWIIFGGAAVQIAISSL